ncbi:MAG: SDR family oxidoreductase [Acidobacteriota bacterium]
MELEGKVALITGASSGIGAAVASELASAGMKLFLTARRRHRLEERCVQLEQSAFLAGDLTDSLLPEALLRETLSQFGRCDVVVNNAGILEVGTIEEIDLDRLSRMVRINVEGAFRMAYAALRHFKTRARGHLVNISSILGKKVRPGAGAYAGTKHALEALSEALRIELAGSRIAVSCVEPGLVMTELHAHMAVHPAQSFEIREPLEPEDIARAVRYVLEQPDRVHISNLTVLPGQSPL